MNISSVRAMYDAALRRSARLQRERNQSTQHEITDAEVGAVADVRSGKPLGGVEVVDAIRRPTSSYRSTGYSEPSRLSVVTRSSKNHLVHVAGKSHADEARIHRRMRELQQLLSTMNTLQNTVLTAQPISI